MSARRVSSGADERSRGRPITISQRRVALRRRRVNAGFTYHFAAVLTGVFGKARFFGGAVAAAKPDAVAPTASRAASTGMSTRLLSTAETPSSEARLASAQPESASACGGGPVPPWPGRFDLFREVLDVKRVAELDNFVPQRTKLRSNRLGSVEKMRRLVLLLGTI